MKSFLVYVLFLISIAIPLTKCYVYKTNITDFSKCKVYYCRSGALYKDFFRISDQQQHENGTLLLDFHFSVLGPSDAHILLAPSETLQKDDPAYEIVIGAGNNAFSDIRRAQKSSVKASITVKGLLSALDVKSFWLHVSRDGLIEVGKEGEELAFLSWQDSDPLPLRVFSFSTWKGIEAKFFYDCPNESFINATEIPKNYTHLERLRQDLLTDYDSFSHPDINGSVFDISMSFLFYSISLDVYQSTMEVKGQLGLSWKDEKLRWDPAKYGNISRLHLHRQEIWKPDLILHNSINSESNILGDSMAIVNHTGVIVWHPPVNMQAWCKPEDLGYWPNDFHQCNLLFGFWSNLHRMRFVENATSFLKMFNGEWDLLEANASYYLSNTSSDNADFNPSHLNVVFKLKRTSDAYNTIFFAPFLVIAFITLATFWTSPFGHLKISLGCFQLVLTSLVMIGLSKYVPAHPEKIPYFVVLYSYTLIAGLVCLIIATIVINISRKEHEYAVPHFIFRILNSVVTRKVLILPMITVQENYGNLRDVDVPSKTSPAQDTWVTLCIVIDRIAFFIFIVLVGVAYYLRY